MSWLRFTGLDRFSPFTRSPPEGSSTVSDADFSYITNEDLKKHVAQVNADEQDRRDADTLRVRQGRNLYTLSFPPHSIVRGELSVGTVRESLAKLSKVKPRHIELHYRGRKLSDDMTSCADVGLKNGNELLGTVKDNNISESEESDDVAAGNDAGHSAQQSGKKKKRNRSSRNKKKKLATDSPGSAERFDIPSQQQRVSSPALPADPLKLGTPQEKLSALFAILRSYEKEVQAYIKSPPAEQAKRDFEQKKLSEMILTQVLLKTDAVETDGDSDARARRKELVRDTQNLLKSLDDANSSRS